MTGGIHRGADLADTRCRSGRGFVVNNTDGADPALTVGTQPVLDGLRVDAAAPVRLQKLGLDPELSAIFFHRVAKWPVSTISTRSPSATRLASAASQAPVPDAG